MIIDAHVRLGNSFNGKSIRIEDYLTEMSNNKICKAIICPNKPISYRVEDGNEYIEQVLKKYPNKFIGAIRIDPWRWEDMEKEMDIRLKTSEFKLIYLNPWEENYNINNKIVFPIMEKAQNHNLSVVIESGYPWVSHITQIVDIARKYKNVRIIATNAGQLDLSGSTFDDVALAMDKVDNIYLGTAGACGAEWIKNLAEKYKDRVVFESNYPMMHPYIEIFRIEKGFFNENSKRAILGTNIEKLIQE